MISFQQALAAVRQRASPQPDVLLAADATLGHVLAEDLIATEALPGFDNAAMDGFALHDAHLALPPGTPIALHGLQAAGDARFTLGAAACRIMTGAVVPEGTATVVPVESGSKTLKDALNEAMRDWVASVESTHYCLGSVMGPHPYPWMVREFHRVIGTEAREQCLERYGQDPDVIVACVGGGSNAIGIFSGFVDTKARLIGVEPAGGAAVGRGQPGVVHGMRSYLMQDEYGQVQEAHSISAGLDYPGAGPEHSYLASIGRAEYPTVTDTEVIAGFQLLAKTEGIIPALECAHALAWISREAPNMQGQTVLMNLSGRGDKDVGQMMEVLS